MAKRSDALIVLDGGMGHLLRRKGIRVEGEIGSVKRFLGVAMANLEQPDLVREAHEEYLEAGARVITTNSYSCVPRIVGGDEAFIMNVIQAAGEVARKAADQHGAMVAGCLPPLGASYRPDDVGTEEELEQEYARIAAAIAPYSDVLLCETMSCAREAAVAARAAVATGKPVWVSWTLAEDLSGNLVSGESVAEAVRALPLPSSGEASGEEPRGGVTALLFNCSLPECVSVALPKLHAVLPEGIACGAYANGFHTVMSPGGGNKEYRDNLSPMDYAEFCKDWAAEGATIVGGCCGIFPEHIAAVAQEVALAPPGEGPSHSSGQQ